MLTKWQELTIVQFGLDCCTWNIPFIIPHCRNIHVFVLNKWPLQNTKNTNTGGVSRHSSFKPVMIQQSQNRLHCKSPAPVGLPSPVNQSQNKYNKGKNECVCVLNVLNRFAIGSSWRALLAVSFQTSHDLQQRINRLHCKSPPAWQDAQWIHGLPAKQMGLKKMWSALSSKTT